MAKKTFNPFLLQGYKSPSYFCNREQETANLINAVENGRNTTVLAIRRLGKTGLIKHVFYYLGKKKNYQCYYIDIMACQNLAEFTKALTSEILGKLHENPLQILKKAASVLKHIKAQLTFDPATGKSQLQFGINNAQEAEKTLEEVFNYLVKNSRTKRVVIAIDEFQQILNFPEKNVEAILRTRIQHLNNANFIFSGSQKHMLLAMFGHAGRPFYQSTELLSLKRIDNKKYLSFINRFFKSSGKTINKDDIEHILDWTRTHTYYVQYVCNKLYGMDKTFIVRDDINLMFQNILSENEPIFYNYRNLLTTQQWNVLKALAKNGGSNEPTGKEFLKKYDLHAASTVKSCLVALIEKEFVYRENNTYYVYDLFFERWLERM